MDETNDMSEHEPDERERQCECGQQQQHECPEWEVSGLFAAASDVEEQPRTLITTLGVIPTARLARRPPRV